MCYLCLKPKPTAWPLLCLQNFFFFFPLILWLQKISFLSSHSQERESPGPDSELDSSWRRPPRGWLQGKVCLFLDLEQELRQPERGETGAGRGRRRKAGTVAPGPCTLPQGTSQVMGNQKKGRRQAMLQAQPATEVLRNGKQAASSSPGPLRSPGCPHPLSPWKLNRPENWKDK